MPRAKKTANRPIFERLRKRHNIVFVDECTPERWPDDHRQVFEAIEKLNGFRYATYAARQDDSEAAAATPWKAEAKQQARRLADKTKDLVSRNETTWRLACEPLVFSRLAAEVACKNCRKRVWRSEVEVSLDGSGSASGNLRARQDHRDRCRCPMTSRPDDEDETVGLNRLFIDRSDDTVKHPRELALQLPQDQKPDRIYGLRQTRNIEDLLLKKLPDGSLLEDTLHEQPHSTSGQALLFPFLVVEAKSGTAPDDWHSIRLQTAFPIYTYLETQQSLRLATAQRSKWTSGPLVWFYMSKGDDWRLCLAYQDLAGTSRSSERPNHTTNIVTVWTGCITNRDDALQLFLIVDYMSDWARDVYRAAVIRELRILAAPDTDVATVFTDTDIFSTRRTVLDFAVADSGNSGTVPGTDHRDPQAAFKGLDTAFGVVRHAAPIESRFRALFLTEDSVQTFVDSTSNHIRQYFIRQILRQFSFDTGCPVALTPDQISSIEEKWTGHSRLRAPFHLKDAKFYTVYVVTFSLSPSWDQARDLCLIAIQDEAFDVLVAESKLKTKISKPSTNPTSSVVDDIALLKTASVEQNLLACISRRCGRMERHTLRRRDDQEPFHSCSSFRTCHGTLWLLLSYTYKFHKKGDLEPALPFLRISAATEMQRPGHQQMEGSVTLAGYEEDLHISNQGAVLIHGDVHHHFIGASRSPICVYLVRESTEPPNQDDLSRTVKRTFESRDVYHTTRDYGTLNIRNLREYRQIWNLESTYGVFFSYGKTSFVKWLRSLGMPLPTRQGSPRGRYGTGRIMFEREYSPWHDGRLIYGIYRYIKKKFLKKLFVAEVRAWAKIAQRRIRAGHDCCPLCATIDPERSDELSEFEDADGGTEKNDFSSTPLPTFHDKNQQGNSVSIPESDIGGRESGEGSDQTSDGPERGTKSIIKGLCWECTDDLSTRGGWPDWLKRVIREACEKVILTTTKGSGPTPDDPEGYCISTPPRSPFNQKDLWERWKGLVRHDGTPSDSEPEDEPEVSEVQRDPVSHLGAHVEDQAVDTSSVMGSTSLGGDKRTISNGSEDEGARKRQKRRFSSNELRSEDSFG